MLHIFFNVLWIRDLGPVVTELYGPARAFVLFRSWAASAGSCCRTSMGGIPTLGASGSIFGLLGALIAYGRRHGSSMLSTQLWQWAIVLFVMGLVLPAVNNWAHVGGFAGGWLTAQVLSASHERRESSGVALLALALMGITAAGVALSFYNVTKLLGF